MKLKIKNPKEVKFNFSQLIIQKNDMNIVKNLEYNFDN